MEHAVRRDALYIGDAAQPRFACFHTAPQAPARDTVAVLCNPLGHEYVHSHRTLRHLADALARAGVPALRFDYHGTGDSPGSDLDPDRLDAWLNDIGIAIDAARSLSGRTRVCLVGLRFGATLAALVASRRPVDRLVLWSPCAAGRRYLRELQAAAQLMEAAAEPLTPGALQAVGFVMTAQTQEQIKAVQLKGVALQAHGVLLVSRDDMPENAGLADELRAQGLAVQELACGGYAEMMAEPQHTVVPQAAVQGIGAWVAQGADPAPAPAPSTLLAAGSMGFDAAGPEGGTVRVIERASRFGDEGALFGIHAHAPSVGQPHATVVFFSSGVVHRIGPNRLYTELARELAARGFSTFRCDLEGIGDSVLRGAGRENHPYPATAPRDAAAVLHFLKEQHGAGRFVLMGLCSGAYTAFNAGLDEDAACPIAELVLINPLTYHWQEGDSLDTQHYRVMAHYKGNLRRADSWKRLLRGQVDVGRIVRVMLSALRKRVASQLGAAAERWWPSAAPRLSRQLRRLFAQGRRISLFIASGDPGWDMLQAKARYTAREARRRGDLHVEFIDEADHTFTGEAARRRLAEKIVERLRDTLQLR